MHSRTEGGNDAWRATVPKSELRESKPNVRNGSIADLARMSAQCG